MSKRNLKQNQSAIEQRKDDYINATKLCKIHNERTGENKKPVEWLSPKTAKSVIATLSSKVGKTTLDLVDVQHGGLKPGTWIHPRLAVRFTMWLDEEFSLQVEDLVQEWMTAAAAQEAKLSPWDKARREGKEVRREFTDAIQDYITRHPEMPDDAKTWMYANATDKVYMVVFRRTAKQLFHDFQVEDRAPLRNAFTKKELRHVQSVEDLSMRLVDSRDIHPFRAVQEAEVRLLIPVSLRTAILG